MISHSAVRLRVLNEPRNQRAQYAQRHVRRFRVTTPLAIGLALDTAFILIEAITQVTGTNRLGYEEPRSPANSRRRRSVTKRLSRNERALLRMDSSL